MTGDQDMTPAQVVARTSGVAITEILNRLGVEVTLNCAMRSQIRELQAQIPRLEKKALEQFWEGRKVEAKEWAESQEERNKPRDRIVEAHETIAQAAVQWQREKDQGASKDYRDRKLWAAVERFRSVVK